MFEQDSALAHRASEKAEFLDRYTSDFMSPCRLVLTRWKFFICEPVKLIKNGGKPVNLTGNKSTSYAWTCLFNCAAHAYDV